MQNYQNLLPMGENFVEPPQPPPDDERDALIALYDALLRQKELCAQKKDKPGSKKGAKTSADADVFETVCLRLGQIGCQP